MVDLHSLANARKLAPHADEAGSDWGRSRSGPITLMTKTYAGQRQASNLCCMQHLCMFIIFAMAFLEFFERRNALRLASLAD